MSVYVYNVGEFRHRVELQHSTVNKINGRPVECWETIHKTRAKTYKDNKTSTTEENQGDTDKVVKRLLIRTPKSLEINNNYRVLYKGNQYKIKSSNDIKDLGVYTELVIERVEQLGIELKGLNNVLKKLDNLSNVKTEHIVSEVAKDMQEAITKKASEVSQEGSNFIGISPSRKYDSSCFIDVGLKNEFYSFEDWKSLWFQHWGFNDYGLNFTGQYYVATHKMWYDEAVNGAANAATIKLKNKLKQEVRKAIS